MKGLLSDRQRLVSQNEPLDIEKIEAREYMIRVLKKSGRKISEDMPSSYGFALFIFSFTDIELLYISNAMREDIIKILRRFLDSQGENTKC